MEFFGRPPAPLSGAKIRELYEQNPTPQGRALAWEIWRLQRAIVALEAGLRHASGLRHRQDIIDQVRGLRECVQDEPCLNEPLAVRPGHRRGGDNETPVR